MTTAAHDRAQRFLDHWLSGAVLILITVQLAGWLPHYLRWPYWADHDVFANAARAWTEGRLPYRDTRLNNFPGTIYLFWVIGRVIGWGRPVGLYALDAGLLLTLGGMLTLWSRRRFGQSWPGLLGFLVYLSFGLSLDYAHAAQRDWQASALVVLALLVTQTARGAVGLIGSAGLAAAGFAIRPQVILIWPALILSVGWLDPARPRSVSARRALIWVGVLVGFVILSFLPLVIAGVLSDFLGSLRLVSPGSGYNRVTLVAVAQRWTEQARELRWWSLILALVVSIPNRPSGSDRRLGWIGLLALAGVSFYQPLSPVAHSYLDIPLPVVGAVVLAVALGLLAYREVGPASLRLVAVAGLVAMGGTTLRPRFVQVGPTVAALRGLGRGGESLVVPPGYRHGSVATSAYYPWQDYRATLDYLRDSTRPETRIANLLKGDPAIVGMLDRGSALPAESVAWLRMVRPLDEGAFAGRLRESVDSVVVWDPDNAGPDPTFTLHELGKVVRELYQPVVRFGSIEVWRRKPADE